MPDICFYFQVHQPYRLKKYTVFDIGKNKEYFDETKNRKIAEKVARKCYIPTNNIIQRLINQTNGRFKVAYSITGTALEQFEKYVPEVLESFKDLAKTGCVEFLSETYYHSLAFLYSKEEFDEQVAMHKNAIKRHFGQTPKIFRNTELIYNNELANHVSSLGFKGILAEGADHVLGWRSPNFVYSAPGTDIRLLLKNYRLSDDIAFRFSNKGWVGYPLTCEKFAGWASGNDGHTINLFMDYETFGEHQWEDTGIFNFLTNLPKALEKKGIGFKTPSEIVHITPISDLDIDYCVSWADMERDLSAWLGNRMQLSAINELYQMERSIKLKDDDSLLENWRKLQTSDHFYYMCTKWFSDGDVHKYFNPYETPYDSYINMMNILNDMAARLKEDNKINIFERPSLVIG